MNKVQVWLSVNVSIVNLSNGLYVDNFFFPIGHEVENRIMGRMIIKAESIASFFADLQMRCVNPIIIGVQNMDGTEYDAVTYPKNITEFNKFMQQTNGIYLSQNTAAGWEPFILI